MTRRRNGVVLAICASALAMTAYALTVHTPGDLPQNIHPHAGKWASNVVPNELQTDFSTQQQQLPPAEKRHWEPAEVLALRDVDTLLELLNHEDGEIRLHAAAAFGAWAEKYRWTKSPNRAINVHPDANRVIEAVSKVAREDRHRMVRFQAIDSLGRLGASEFNSIEGTLVEIARSDADPLIARKAERSLAVARGESIGAQQSLALREMQKQEEQLAFDITRERLGNPLRKPGPYPHSSYSPAKVEQKLRQEFPQSPFNNAFLMKLAHGDNYEQRYAAMEVLIVRSRSNEENVAEDVASLLFHPNRAIRETTRAAMWGKGHDAELAAVLTYAIQHELSISQFVELTCQIEPNDHLARSIMSRLYEHQDNRVRIAVVDALRRSTKRIDDGAEQFLSRCWGDPDDELREAAHEVIVSYGWPQQIAKRLIEEYTSNPEEMPDDVVVALGQAGKALSDGSSVSLPATVLLQQKLQVERDAQKRLAIVKSLSHIAPIDDSMVSCFADFLAEDQPAEIRSIAANVLEQHGTNARAALPELLMALEKEKDPTTLISIAKAIRAIVPDNKAVHTHVSNLIEHALAFEVGIPLQRLIEDQQSLIDRTEAERKKTLLKALLQ